GFGFITIKPDETLGHITDWLGLTTDELRKINKLSDGQSAKIGQKIKVTFSNISRNEFDQKRMEYHRSIEEDFFANYQIDGVKIHRIQTGENIWLLCTDIYSLPYWLIQKYNPSANLEQLQAGELLVIPEVVEKNKS
ncbi:MAG: LysM domain-containing protein, partial [bacterium]|nr:LysM domain-containing protein [bacterium]